MLKFCTDKKISESMQESVVNTKHFITKITDGISANVFICSIMSIVATYVPDNYDLLSFYLYR